MSKKLTMIDLEVMSGPQCTRSGPDNVVVKSLKRFIVVVSKECILGISRIFEKC